MVEITADLGNFAYIPLSGLIILLVILLTCASRKKKYDTYYTVGNNFEDDIKEDYIIMCFPCLKKKPDLSDFKLTEDLSDQFEYIVEKYTIRKVPLILANTTEDLIERQKELELGKCESSEPELLVDNTLNFQVSQEVYNVQKIPPCITFGASTSCRNKNIKERPMPSDILESMSPVTMPPVGNRNYVAIPTKASLRHKDIMMTKREITNQYLNNFSSVFVDNLKDQVPKDPEQFPRLSRPYTSAFRSFPISDNSTGKSGKNGKKSKKGKNAKVAYAYPLEETFDERSFAEDPSYDSDMGQEPTHCQHGKENCEYQEDTENGGNESIEKPKSFVLVNDSYSLVNEMEEIPCPFKTILKSSTSLVERSVLCGRENDYPFSISFHKDNWTNSKNVTYEDIQALDVGYEFNSCEKLGVKPKMIRIHGQESENIQESKKLAEGDSSKQIPTKETPQEKVGVEKSTAIALKLPVKPDTVEGTTVETCNTSTLFPTEKLSLKSFLTETSFLPQSGSADLDQQKDSFLLSTRSEDSKSQSLNETDLINDIPVNNVNSFLEITKMFHVPKPTVDQKLISNNATDLNKDIQYHLSSRSRSFHEPGFPSSRRESEAEVKGKNNKNSNVSTLYEPETETTYSLGSRDSKMSSVMTSPKSSEVDEGKRATLRWKIIIKHHKEDNFSKKFVNLNKYD